MYIYQKRETRFWGDMSFAVQKLRLVGGFEIFWVTWQWYVWFCFAAMLVTTVAPAIHSD